ncbi:hypothetical protein M431DRAFT_494162 [Trichoderma harzianum CBS 226.95]|uniref:Uncharacterized protein n=1 Tax=Trichoderma harzianum CBS 226.95 TaxID=983964 RepID=A0A2T4AF75_TRIHA|nr:hypothetical protein M431DRAFT_494162 [Trichoderma harzianum CBS 226.95]PTB55727.1 hypothetical protein M431DRAFT_494162 [Trichoderma harzianum CBS 226.95]
MAGLLLPLCKLILPARHSIAMCAPRRLGVNILFPERITNSIRDNLDLPERTPSAAALWGAVGLKSRVSSLASAKCHGIDGS